MENSIFVVSADGEIEAVSTSLIYKFDIKWTPLMPFIQSHFNMPYSQRSFFGIPEPSEEESIEMGLYCIEENKKINAPFVWNHIKIETIEIVKGQSEKEDSKFKAEVVIYGQKYSRQNNYKHTFIVRKGVYFFMYSILGTINKLLDKGFSIEDIDFDFLDKQCDFFPDDYRDHKFKLCHEFHTSGFYELISTMKLEVYNAGYCDRYHESIGLGIKLFLNTIDKYIVYVLTTVLKKHSAFWGNSILELHTMSDTNSTIFSLILKCNDDESYFHRNLKNGTFIEKYRKEFSMIFFIEGAKMLNEDTATEYLSIKHKEYN